MHASIWKLEGDPADLLDRYDSMLAEIPTASMQLHLCLCAEDGIVIIDTCPSAKHSTSSQGAKPSARCSRITASRSRLNSTTTQYTPRSSKAEPPRALQPPHSRAHSEPAGCDREAARSPGVS